MEKGPKKRNELNLICNEFHEIIKQIKPCNLETYKVEPIGTFVDVGDIYVSNSYSVLVEDSINA